MDLVSLQAGFKGFFEKLTTVFQGFSSLPFETNRYERLPLFAQRTTGNPHFFDHNQVTGKLLVNCMQVDQQLKGHREPGCRKQPKSLMICLAAMG